MTILTITHSYYRGPGWYVWEFNKNKIRIFPVANEEYGIKRGFDRVEWLDNPPEGRRVIHHRETMLMMG